MIKKIINNNFDTEHILKVLDLGGGDGNSINFFNKIERNIECHGIDPENLLWASGNGISINFHYYGSLHIPYEYNYFYVSYCNQVFEYMRYLELLLHNILWVLINGGRFIGATSHLEPFHPLSFWNYPPLNFFMWSILIYNN